MLYSKLYEDLTCAGGYLVACQTTRRWRSSSTRTATSIDIIEEAARAQSDGSWPSPRRTFTRTSCPGRASWRGETGAQLLLRARAEAIGSTRLPPPTARASFATATVRRRHAVAWTCGTRRGTRRSTCASSSPTRAAGPCPVGMFIGRFHLRRRRGPPRSARARGERRRNDGADGSPPLRSLRATDSFPAISSSGRDTAPARRAAKRSARCRPRRSATSDSRTGRFRSTSEDDFVRDGARGPARAAEVFRADEDRSIATVRRAMPARGELAELDLAALRGALRRRSVVIDVAARRADFARGAHPRVDAQHPDRHVVRDVGGIAARPRPRHRAARRRPARASSSARRMLALIGLDRVVGWAGRDVRADVGGDRWPLQTRRSARRGGHRRLAIAGRSSTCAAPPSGAPATSRARGICFSAISSETTRRSAARHADRRPLPGRHALGDRREPAASEGIHQRRER